MRIFRWTAALLITLACKGNTQGASTAPIRVLVVTATHGFRHTEAIDASKERLKSNAEFAFDFTEDPSTITAANLGRYDVLFLNNATLRVAAMDPTDSASRAAVRWPRTGVATPITRDQQQAIAA